MGPRWWGLHARCFFGCGWSRGRPGLVSVSCLMRMVDLPMGRRLQEQKQRFICRLGEQEYRHVQLQAGQQEQQGWQAAHAAPRPPSLCSPLLPVCMPACLPASAGVCAAHLRGFPEVSRCSCLPQASLLARPEGCRPRPQAALPGDVGPPLPVGRSGAWSQRLPPPPLAARPTGLETARKERASLSVALGDLLLGIGGCPKLAWLGLRAGPTNSGWHNGHKETNGRRFGAEIRKMACHMQAGA